MSIATAAIPGITRHAAADDVQGVRNDVSQALRMMLTLNVPATFGLMCLAGPIIELLVDTATSHPQHRRHRRRAHGLRAWPRRLLRGEDRLADVYA